MGLLLISSLSWAGGDSIILRDGKELNGDILFCSGTSFIISIDGRTEQVPISDIKQINFGAAQPNASTVAPTAVVQ